MFTYENAMNIFNSMKRKANQKKLANNTYLIDRGDHYAVRLHNTDIVKLYANGEVIYNTNGWTTVTTKDRMNQFSPFYIQQKKNVWSVWQGSRFIGLYEDGLKLAHNGRKVA